MSIDLMKGENIVHEGKRHWSVLVLPGFLGFIGLSLFAAPNMWPVSLFFLAWFGIRFMEYRAVRLLVTNKRVILNTGWMSKSCTDIPLAKIETVKADTGTFNVGTITVVGSGGTAATIKNLIGPNAFKNAIQEQMK